MCTINYILLIHVLCIIQMWHIYKGVEENLWFNNFFIRIEIHKISHTFAVIGKVVIMYSVVNKKIPVLIFTNILKISSQKTSKLF